ncbi:MAG: VCBS repeat-containing protein, partial [Planctomycetes bacterium]|nr:VCBS repeat-containing protein [Planctomycetota bacterium]
MYLFAVSKRSESAFRTPNLGVCLRFLTVLCCGLLVHQETASADVVASYSFDDGSASDGSGNGHDGMKQGAPQVVAGIEGSALHFDGLADAISIPHSASFPSDSFTLSAWVRVSATPRVDSIVLQKYADGVGYRLRIDGESGAVVLEANGVSVQAPFPLFANVWTFVTGSYDGSDLVLGIDGTTAASASIVGLATANTADVWIASDAGVADHFLGDIDEVAIDDTSWADSVVCANAKLVWDSANNLCAFPFVDVAADLGVEDAAHVGFGACLVDIDQDGWLDLYFVNGSDNPMTPQPDGECVDPDDLPDEFPFVNINSLYMNNGDGTFTENVAAEFGLDDGWNAMRNVFGDYDNDGLRDMFSHNFLRSTLYHAVSGPDPMVYEDWNDETGLHICLRDGTGASWVDLNFDGWLDLYTVEYNFHVPPEEGISYLHISNGDGTFTEVTAEAGIDLPQNAMGVAFADYDNDGDQDVFVTNSYPTVSRLYRNEGVNENGVPLFIDVAEEAGVALDDQGGLGVGVGWGDYNNDGYLDMLFSRTGDSRLFRNDGPDGSGIWRFTDVTAQGGFNVAGGNFWGGNFADLDNDGWLDVMLMNRSNSSSPNLLFMNNRDGTWREVAEFHGMDVSDLPQLGFVPGDIDNDGDLDVVLVTHTTEPNALFRNDGRGNNWIQFRLKGTMSNRDAVGARIPLTATPQPGEPG